MSVRCLSCLALGCRAVSCRVVLYFVAIVHSVGGVPLRSTQTGQLDSATRLRAVLHSESQPSGIFRHFPHSVQDAYSLRCVPQVHGIVHDTVTFVKNLLSRELNAATDNPMVFREDDAVISAGNFHGEYPAKARTPALPCCVGHRCVDVPPCTSEPVPLLSMLSMTLCRRPSGTAVGVSSVLPVSCISVRLPCVPVPPSLSPVVVLTCKRAAGARVVAGG
jgi:hypothetical protein